MLTEKSLDYQGHTRRKSIESECLMITVTVSFAKLRKLLILQKG